MKFALFLVVLGLALPSAALLQASLAPLEPDSPVLVVHPPWVDTSALLDQAGGREIGPLSATFGVLALGGSGFAEKLQAAGAWAVLNGRLIAELCARNES